MCVVGICEELFWCEWIDNGVRRINLFSDAELELASQGEIANVRVK